MLEDGVGQSARSTAPSQTGCCICGLDVHRSSLKRTLLDSVLGDLSSDIAAITDAVGVWLGWLSATGTVAYPMKTIAPAALTAFWKIKKVAGPHEWASLREDHSVKWGSWQLTVRSRGRPARYPLSPDLMLNSLSSSSIRRRSREHSRQVPREGASLGRSSQRTSRDWMPCRPSPRHSLCSVVMAGI